MKFKQMYSLLLGALLIWGAPLAAEEANNLIKNPSFENYETKSFFGSNYADFEEWETAMTQTNAETTDVLDGAVALKLGANVASSVYQQITGLTDANYEANRPFRFTIHFKAVTIASGGSVSINCYWEHETIFEGLKYVDADQLQRVLSDSVQNDWQTLVVETKRPEKAKSFMIQFKAVKNCYVLIDSLAFEALPMPVQAEPFIEVTPKNLSQVTVNKGETADFAPLHITQGNLNGETTFELSGYNPEQFRLSASSLAADKSELDLLVTYAPTEAGTHTAVLNIDNLSHTTLFQSIKLTGSCVDPSLNPTLSVTPSVVPAFEAVVGKAVTKTLTVTSANCTDYVYMRVDHTTGAAFTIDGSMFAKNTSSEVTVRFAPLEAGEYQSTLTIYSEGATSLVLTLNGTARQATEADLDWQTKFAWDESAPVKLLDERFSSIEHNKTLILSGWQNVAPKDQRPWWGFDEQKTSPARGTERYAKATAYQYAKDSTGIWETWLVTPALDYKNAESKIFTFSVMGEYLPEENNPTVLEVYYVDVETDSVYFQNLTASFSIPTTANDANDWRIFYLDLAPYAETMADVFHIAFRYAGPNGGAGAATYYIDNVSWGRADLPTISVEPAYLIDSTAQRGQKTIIGAIQVTGRNLTDVISLSLEGANYNRFELSTAELPSTGGECIVSFEAQEYGVHEAYIRLASKGAPDIFVPLAVACRMETGLTDNRSDERTAGRKTIRDGVLYLTLPDGSIFNTIGARVK